jgi:tetratricopeptide (TPR) repeat protein
MYRAPFSSIGLLLLVCLAASPCRGEELKDLYFGEALYHAHQGDFFEALERLDAEIRQHDSLDEPELGTLEFHIDDAEFSLGDFELRYRMHHRAGRAIKAVLEGAVDEVVRNDAAFRLARIHFQKNQLPEALRALERIDGKIPDSIRDDIEFLRANVYLSEGRAADAIEILKRLQSSDSFGDFASYNLGIALLEDGQQQAALTQLDRAGQKEVFTVEELAIKDKSNLVLGTIFLEAGEYSQAKPFLNRVRLDGPFSNQALLSAGWANVSMENYERAVVPWSILADREVTDPATQEAMLALPYAYGKLNVHGRAALYYGRALDSFGIEVEKLNASIDSIREGRFLEALIREEIRQSNDWIIKLRALPEAPETYYMMQLLASHDFQTGLQNYLDLADLHRKLVTWQLSFDSFDDMVGIRRSHYSPLLPEVDEQFRALDSRIRLRIEQHKLLVKRKNDMLTTPRPEFLATQEEQAILKRIESIESRLQSSEGPFEANLMERARRLKGSLTWVLETEYHERLARFDENLQNLNVAMAVMQEKYDEYVRTRQAATHSYEGYEDPINRLRMQVSTSIDKVEQLMLEQGRKLEVTAIEELAARRGRLEDYRNNARFALADSYDRATQSQAKIGGDE